jgi:hypothetical protein
MELKERIDSFSVLGNILREALEGRETQYTSGLNDLILDQQHSNPWFTPPNVRMAISAIADTLTRDNLERWTNSYPGLNNNNPLKNVGIVMAGNIPLVGFHDFLSVLIAGHNLIAKTSSKDKDLILFVSNILCRLNKEFAEKIAFTDGVLKNFDTVIATGSDNSSRYFEYYFGKYPHIIRKNRNSIAIIDGSETDAELEDLGQDIFSYFGLGCRNVSKIFLPEGYDTDRLAAAWKDFAWIADHHKYANNYDYNKAIYMVNRESFKDTGFLLLKESDAIASPVAVLYFEFYSDRKRLSRETERYSDRIQCIVSRDHVPFGMSQRPHLWDYADGVDTIEFLLKKK